MVLLVWNADRVPRPLRTDEAGGRYHTLNRDKLRATIFHKDASFEGFERILSERLQFYHLELFSFQWMPKDCHVGLRPVVESGGVLFGIGDTNLPRCFRRGRSPDFLDRRSESTLRYRTP